MRLFLASSYFGNHVDYLNQMVGNNRIVLIIFNARDYRSELEKTEKYRTKEIQMFIDQGYDVIELDLRNYFGKNAELLDYINNISPGLIWLTGGSVFLLRKALELSGLDEILKKDLKNNKYVLGGYSAASMVVSPSIRHCDISFNRLKSDNVKEIYNSEANFSGLGIIDGYLCPHSDAPNHIEANQERVKILGQQNIIPCSLNDSDVYIVNDNAVEILK